MKNLIKILSIIYLLLLASCSGEIDPLDYVDNLDQRYPGKANKAVAFGGKDRLKIEFELSPDPNVNKAVIYWNSKKDSVVINNIDRTKDNTISKIIKNLPESVYNFEIFTYDKFGNRSVPVHLTGRTYGDRYASVIAERKLLKHQLVNLQGDIELAWGDSIVYSVGVYLKYTDMDNKIQNDLILNTDKSTILEQGISFPKQAFEYRTFFIPEIAAIDTFYSSIQTLDFDPDDYDVIVEMPKPYANAALKGDQAGSNWDRLWDKKVMSGPEKYGEVGWGSFVVEGGSRDPVWVTIDVKESIRIQRIRGDFYYFYAGTMPRVLDVLAYTGTGTPPSLEVGSADYWKDWKIIHTFKTLEENTNDNAGFQKGLDKTFNAEDVPTARYFRLRNNELNFFGNPNTNFSLSELTFWAHVGF